MDAVIGVQCAASNTTSAKLSPATTQEKLAAVSAILAVRFKAAKNLLVECSVVSDRDHRQQVQRNETSKVFTRTEQ